MAADPAQKTDRLSPALDLVPEAVVAWNDDGKITAWNAAATRLFGYTRTEAVNRSVTVLVPPDRSEEQTQIEASLLADSTPQELNSVRRNRSGKRIPVHIHYPLAALVGRPFRTLVPNAQLADAQRHGSGAAAEQGVPGRRVDGTMFAVGVSINPAVLDGAAYVAVVRDETERRAAERIKNEFLSVISHELRTPLTSIRGSLGLLEAGVLGALPDEAQEIVGIAR
ncbi:MAG: PAS domain S-box-containing protein, partial [Myxococcota bacterium]